MPKKVKKVFGENPEVVGVLNTQVEFDAEGNAIVEDEIAEVLEQIPGYAVEGDAELAPAEDPEPEEEETEEEADESTSEEVEESEEVVEEEVVKPKRPARKTPSKR